jgi:5-amino-6-(5-phosphoribosylamino)uracil reductase
VRQLLPSTAPPAAADLTATYGADDRPAPPGRPWVLANMVASVDGATAVDGRSGALGGPVDRAAFTAIRAIPDVILVAAGTARAEGYGPPKTPEAIQATRERRGQSAKPRIALVTRSVDLDLDTDLFADPTSRCIVVVPTDAPADRVAAVRAVADVLEAGTGGVDLPECLRQLRAGGASVVLAEGGPSLLGQLAAADLIDEQCLTVSPNVVSGGSPRIIHGDPVPDGLAPMRLARILEEDGVLLLRYVRDRD